MDVSPLAPSAEGGGDQRFLAIVVKLTELDGRHIKGPHAFERVSFFCDLTVSFFSLLHFPNLSTLFLMDTVALYRVSSTGLM